MSFILEALRKSEQERQRNQSPGMADLHARNRATGRRYWLPLVIFLVGLNIGLLLFLWINGTPPPGSTTATPPAVVAPSPNAAPAAPPADSAPAAAAPSDMPTAPAAAAIATPPVATTVPSAERELASELPPRPVSRISPAQSAGTSETRAGAAQMANYSNLPTLEELTLAGSISLSPLRIDMHVFSPLPAERFVFINMHKYREGDTLREGPVLNEITEDGVILAHQGRSFLVTRE